MIRNMPRTRLSRSLLWTGGIVAGLVVLLAAGAGIMMLLRMNSAPSDLDYSTTRISDQGLYKVSYSASNETPATDSIPINQMHNWTLHVESADGQPVENATITVDGDMPQHGHGLSTSPRVTRYLGNGDYLVEGMKFQMGGWWVMDFTITANEKSDAVHFNMVLNK